MSEAVSWPPSDSGPELARYDQATETEDADIIPFPNSTGLLFNRVTEQELTDYIGQTAQNMGIDVELGWTENYGIVYRCSSSVDYDDFNNLLIDFEDSQEGAAAPDYCSGSEILILTEIPEDEIVHVTAGYDEVEGRAGFASVNAGDLTYQLISPQTYRVAITNRAYGIEGDMVTPLTDKINKYNFAGFIKDACDRGFNFS